MLVEGVSEMKVIHHFLQLLKLAHKVMLIPLGGESMINKSREFELSELARIGTPVFAVIDSEKKTAADADKVHRLEFQAACNKHGIVCHILKRRATENYLTGNAARQVSDKFVAPKEYDELKTNIHGWKKNDNWRIAKMMTWDDVKDTDLGKFLEALK